MGFNPHWTSLTTKPLPSAWEWVTSRYFTTYNSCFPMSPPVIIPWHPVRWQQISHRNNSTGKSPVTVDWFPMFHAEIHAGSAQIHHLGALWNRQNFLNGAPMPGSSWADEAEEKDQAASFLNAQQKGGFHRPKSGGNLSKKLEKNKKHVVVFGWFW